MLPEEALELGLVDEVSTEHVLAKTNMAARLHVMNKIDLPPLPEKFRRGAETGVGDCQSPETAKKSQSPETAKKSIGQMVKDALKEFFGGAVANIAPAEPVKPVEDSETTKLPNSQIMHEEFTLVNGLLGCDHLEETDGRITLTVDDMKTLNDHLGTLDALRTNIDTLTTERDTARQELTDATTLIDGISDDIAALGTIAEKVTAIKDVLSKAAGCTTENHAENEGNGHAVATDPVNRLVQPYRK